MLRFSVISSFWATCCLLWLACVDGLRAAESRERTRASASPSVHRPWIWAVAGGRAKIWLVGSIHYGLKEDAAIFAPYRALCEQADEVYFEVRPGVWDSYEARQLMARFGYLPYGRTLANSVSPRTLGVVEQGLSNAPGQLRAISRMRPWLAAVTFLQYQYEQEGLRRRYSIEDELYAVAARRRRFIGGLESLRDQVLALADASSAEQEEFLRDATRNPPANIEHTRAVRNAWLRGDEGLLRAALRPSRDRPRIAMDDRLIGERNQHWAQRLREIAKRGKACVIVVGIEHVLTADHSLLSALQKQQLEARRLTDPEALLPASLKSSE